jgi:hypothetical protein
VVVDFLIGDVRPPLALQNCQYPFSGHSGYCGRRVFTELQRQATYYRAAGLWGIVQWGQHSAMNAAKGAFETPTPLPRR